MNLFAVYALVCIAAGIGIAIVRLPDGDAVDSAWALLLGAGKGYLYFVLSCLALFIPFWLWLQVFPVEPKCRNGRCGQMKYRHLAADTVPDARQLPLLDPEAGRWLLRCACGDVYLREQKEGRFLFVHEDGTTVPFRRRGRLGRWLPDEACAAG